MLLYFVPLPVRTLTVEQLAQRGLTGRHGPLEGIGRADLAGEGRFAVSEVAHGPGGAAGTILAPLPSDPTRPLPPIGYYPHAQTWQDGAGYAVGLPETGAAPDDLARRRIIPGYSLPLADGQTWTIAVLRYGDGRCGLPERLGVDAGGALTRALKPEWRDDWALAGRIVDQFLGRSRETISTDEAFRIALRILAVNYRVCPWGASLLGLFDEETVLAVLGCAIDLPRLRRLTETPEVAEACDALDPNGKNGEGSSAT
jgi:hypothetical protein